MANVLLVTGEVVDDNILVSVWDILRALYTEHPSYIAILHAITFNSEIELSDEVKTYLIQESLLDGIGRMNPEVSKILKAVFGNDTRLRAQITWPTTDIREPRN